MAVLSARNASTGLLKKRGTAAVNVFDGVDGAPHPTRPFDGVRNDHPTLEPEADAHHVRIGTLSAGVPLPPEDDAVVREALGVEPTSDRREVEAGRASKRQSQLVADAFEQLSGASVTPRSVIKALGETLVYFDEHRDELFSMPASEDDAEGSDE